MIQEGSTRPPVPTAADILAHLRQVAREQLEFKPEQVERIDLDTRVVEGLQLDSLAQVVLLTELQDHYGFVLGIEEREELQGVQTVRDLVELVRRLASEPGRGP